MLIRHSYYIFAVSEDMDHLPPSTFFKRPISKLNIVKQEEYVSRDDDGCTEDKPSISGAAYAAVAASHLAAGHFDRAICAYSSALKQHLEKEEQITLYLGRSEAYSCFSQHLRDIPAAESERQAIYAPDPHALASSALRDAESALRLESSRVAAVHTVRGDALFLLERYNEARDSYCLANSHSPSSRIATKLTNCVAALSDNPDAGTNIAGDEGGTTDGTTTTTSGITPCAAMKAQVMQDVECTLCLKLLFEPVTTPCGHTFCSPCLARSYDHANKCPMCRTVLHVGQLPVSIVLKNILERGFPEEYEARRREEIEAAGASGEAALLPLFVMNPMLPGERMALNVFEPRYRLMVRRVMAGARRFGMATVKADHSLHDVCCEVEVTECEPLTDGRYYIEVVGRRRFRPCDAQEQDGYRVARPEYVSDDDEPVPGSAEADELAAVAADVERMADVWVGKMRTLGQSRRAAAELLRRVEGKPACQSREKLSFWVVGSKHFFISSFTFINCLLLFFCRLI